MNGTRVSVRALAAACALAIASGACGGGGAGSPTGTPDRNRLFPLQGFVRGSVSGGYSVVVPYFVAQPGGYSITCEYPERDGQLSVSLPMKPGANTYQIDGTVTTPGSYTITCRDSEGDSDVQAFEVASPAPSSPGITITDGTPTPGPAPTNVSYGLVFHPEKAVHTPDGTNGYYDPIGCWVRVLTYWPSVTVAENGDLSGECTWASEASSYRGHLTGRWDRATG